MPGPIKTSSCSGRVPYAACSDWIVRLATPASDPRHPAWAAALTTESSSIAATGLGLLFSTQKLVDLVLDFLEIHERTIDRGEADVGDLIQPTELVHDQLPDLARGNFDLAPGSEFGLDLIDHPFDRAG